MELNSKNTNCRNCGAEMPADSLYCPSCSQKNTDGRVPVFSFLKDLIEDLFNLDSKLFQTGLGLFVPGKLTNEFFRGKHKSFARPSRLFLASTILFFAVVSLMVKNGLDDDLLKVNLSEDANSKRKGAVLMEMEKIKENLGADLTPEMSNQFDSIEQKILNDSIVGLGGTLDVQLFSNKEYKFDPFDFEKLTMDSMIQKYEIEGLIDQIFFKQAYKLNKNPRSLVVNMIGNFTWMMLLLIPSLALVFKLLYIRRQKFYVEHLVFLFHIHAFVLLVSSVVLGILYFEFFELVKYEEQITFATLGILLFYILLSLKKVYQQSWFKTLLKSFLILMSYFFLFTFWLSIILIVSFLLF